MGNCRKNNRKKPVRKKSDFNIKRSNGKSSSSVKLSVEKQTLLCRRYEEYHDNILNYDKIVDLLRKIQKRSSGKTAVVQIGKSTQGKPIYMAIITTGLCSSNSDSPKLGAFITAGLNGMNTIAVSNALYMIDFLSHNPNFIRIMDYYIVPCSNPDVYDSYVKKKELSKKKINKRSSCTKQGPKRGLKSTESQSEVDKNNEKSVGGIENDPPTDLSQNFPVILGVNDMRNIPTDLFLEKIKKWKENYLNNSPEIHTLLQTIYSYRFVIRLLISLQEGGENICYPYGFCAAIDKDTADLREVAKKGKSAICSRQFTYGSIFELQGLLYGTLIDFLKIDKFPVKYIFDIQVHKKTPRYNEQGELKQLLRYGDDVMSCVKRMSCAVYKSYTDITQKKQIESKVMFTKPK